MSNRMGAHAVARTAADGVGGAFDSGKGGDYGSESLNARAFSPFLVRRSG